MNAIRIAAEGFVDNKGKLQLFDRIGFVERLHCLANQDVLIVVEPLKAKRTNPQNRYYWGVVIPFVNVLLEEAGWSFSAQQTHDYLRAEFCQQEIINPKTGEIRTIVQSTTQLSTQGFQNYIEKINAFVAEHFGVALPPPQKAFFQKDSPFLNSSQPPLFP